MQNLALRPDNRPGQGEDVSGDLDYSSLGPTRATRVSLGRGVVHDANIGDVMFDTIIDGNLTATGTLTAGKFQTAASPAARIEITSTLIAGYSDATTKQFYLSATDGKAYAGAGKVILDSNGVTINNADGTSYLLLTFQKGGAQYGYIHARDFVTFKTVYMHARPASGDSAYSQYGSVSDDAAEQAIFTATTVTGDAQARISVIAAGNTRSVSWFYNSNAPYLNVDGDIVASAAVQGTQPVCRVFNAGAQTIGDSAWTSVAHDSEDFDPNGLHSTVSNTSRITVALAGKYLVGGQIAFVANATGVRGIRLIVDGATVIEQLYIASSGGTNPTRMNATTAWNLAANSYVEVQAYQESGGNLNINGATAQVHLWVAYIGQ